MSSPAPKYIGRLRRLTPEYYRGFAVVHWSMTIEDRRTGWLDALSHARLREELCHTLARYQIVCPAYCFMPEHAHFLWLGASLQSDQRLAAAHFRKNWNRLLSAKGMMLRAKLMITC